MYTSYLNEPVQQVANHQEASVGSAASVGFAMADLRRKRRFRDAGAALGLLVYLAPLFAMASVAVRVSGPGSLFRRREVVTAEGQRVRLLHFRTAPSADARWWQRKLLKCLQVTCVATLPALVNVIRGDIELREAVKAV